MQQIKDVVRCVHTGGGKKTTSSPPAKKEHPMVTKNKVYKFASYANASSFSNHMTKPTVVVLGDDGKYWVPATMADFSRLLRAGYEMAPN